jgi:hypothetical protein
MGRSWKAAHFGLGAAGRAERVTVTWRDGREVTLMDVAADQAIEVEPPGS